MINKILLNYYKKKINLFKINYLIVIWKLVDLGINHLLILFHNLINKLGKLINKLIKKIDK